jgi:hypothetical protein
MIQVLVGDVGQALARGKFDKDMRARCAAR